MAQLSTLDLIAMPLTLAKPESKPDLIRWDVPFADRRWPSVGFITDPDSSKVVLVVRPGGLGSHPSYLVRFSDVVTLFCYEETCAIKRDFDDLTWSEPNLCAYRWLTSPWLEHYRVLEDITFTNTDDKLHHYILLGADTIVELIALGEGEIERVDQKKLIDVKYEV